MLESVRMVRGERQLGEYDYTPVNVKKLVLVTPRLAREEYGLAVDRPVFTADCDSQSLIYEVGKTVRVEGFFDPLDTGSVHDQKRIDKNISAMNSHPRVGIVYHQQPRWILDRWGQKEVASWVAVVEPTGTVIAKEDYFFEFNRITDELNVKEIRCFCAGCRSGPLKDGKAVNVYGNGFLFAVCNSDIHDKENGKHPEWFSPKVTFEIAENGEFLLKSD